VPRAQSKTSRVATPPPVMSPLVVDFRDFDIRLHDRVTRDRRLSNFVRSLELPTINVWYEDLHTRPTSTLWQVQDFIGVSRSSTTASILKGTPDDLKVAVGNYKELRAHAETLGVAACMRRE
jgi:hypothetical protein